MSSKNNHPFGSDNLIIYDGECPFCSRYVKMLRIKRASGGVKMMDARGHDSRIKWLSESGYDLNQGMVYVSGGQIYFGADAISALAAISTPSDLFNKINHHILQNKTLSKIIYPVLKSGRNLTLMLLGRDPIKSN